MGGRCRSGRKIQEEGDRGCFDSASMNEAGGWGAHTFWRFWMFTTYGYKYDICFRSTSQRVVWVY